MLDSKSSVFVIDMYLSRKPISEISRPPGWRYTNNLGMIHASSTSFRGGNTRLGRCVIYLAGRAKSNSRLMYGVQPWKRNPFHDYLVHFASFQGWSRIGPLDRVIPSAWKYVNSFIKTENGSRNPEYQV